MGAVRTGLELRTC